MLDIEMIEIYKTKLEADYLNILTNIVNFILTYRK